MGTLATSEDQNEMSHQVVFYQGLHCLLRQNQSSEKEIQYFFLKLLPVTPQYFHEHKFMSTLRLVK